MIGVPAAHAVRPEDLAATEFIDSDHAAVKHFARASVGDADDERAAARRLFAAVRDGVRYDPYRLPVDRAAYRASAVLAAGEGFCVAKSVVLAAAARAAGIPARLGFADVRNHLQSQRLRDLMKTDLFIYHGYTLLHVDGRWLKASCAFNRELCERFGVEPLDFDGRSDALLHAFDGSGERYMEYVRDHGAFSDLPLERLLAVIDETYPGLRASLAVEA